MTDAPTFTLRWGDERALARAAERNVGAVVLHSGSDERWLRLDSPELFADWATTVVEAMPSCRRWMTIDDLNGWPVATYSPFGARSAPQGAEAQRRRVRGSLATGHLLRVLDHQLAAHAMASASLPRGSTVGVGLVEQDPYELRRLLVDVLEAPATGVDRLAIGAYLRQRRSGYEKSFPATTPRRRLLRRLTASAVPLEQALPRAIAAVYETARRLENA